MRKGNSGGTRLRFINGGSLLELQAALESLPYKVDPVQINRMKNGEWFIHFIIPDLVFEAEKPAVTVAAETTTEKVSNKRKS